jgi:hypothetical protein
LPATVGPLPTPAAPIVTPATFAAAPSVTQSQNATVSAISADEKVVDPAATKLRMQVFVSVTILAASLWVLLSKGYDEAYVKWAIAMIGLVVGYWLR